MKKHTLNLWLNGHLVEQKNYSEKVFSGELLHVYKDEAILPNASAGRREWIEHPGACAVVLCFVGDYGTTQQFGIRSTIILEVPAGKSTLMKTRLVQQVGSWRKKQVIGKRLTILVIFIQPLAMQMKSFVYLAKGLPRSTKHGSR